MLKMRSMHAFKSLNDIISYTGTTAVRLLCITNTTISNCLFIERVTICTMQSSVNPLLANVRVGCNTLPVVQNACHLHEYSLPLYNSVCRSRLIGCDNFVKH